MFVPGKYFRARLNLQVSSLVVVPQKFYDVNLLALLVSETLYYCKLALKTKLTFQIDHRLTYNVTNPAELAWDKHLTYFVLPHATKAKKTSFITLTPDQRQLQAESEPSQGVLKR